jgi:hypothetical protein
MITKDGWSTIFDYIVYFAYVDSAVTQGESPSRALPSRGGYSPLCQSASRAKLILGLSSTSKVEDLWTTRLATAYCPRTPFSLIVVALSAMQNSSHLIL